MAERDWAKELADALNQLIGFTEDLCLDLNISRHYPSLDKANRVLDEYNAARAAVSEGKE